jgi:hypothetical protein
MRNVWMYGMIGGEERDDNGNGLKKRKYSINKEEGSDVTSARQARQLWLSYFVFIFLRQPRCGALRAVLSSLKKTPWSGNRFAMTFWWQPLITCQNYRSRLLRDSSISRATCHGHTDFMNLSVLTVYSYLFT